jgi:hypothetical protein
VRYYFHVRNGKTLFDDEGMELSSLAAVREEAVLSSAETLKGNHPPQSFWSGEPWTLWVTDEPNGGGNTILALTFAARATH